MATIVGHWNNLVEAQKLTESVLLKGVIQEIIEEGQLLPRLPVFQIRGKQLDYVREKTLPSAAFYDVHEDIPYQADVEYDEVSVALKIVAAARIIDHFIEDTYDNVNDYHQQMISELRKGCMRTLESKYIYGDATANPKEFDGLWNICDANMLIENHGTGGALSLIKWRELIDTMKVKPDIWLMPRAICRRIDAAFQEGDLGKGQFSWGQNQVGERIMYFQGTPIVRSDYMLMTEGDSAPTGASNGSIFGIKFGQLHEQGLCMCFGGKRVRGEIFKLTELDELENKDSGGTRLVAYICPALGGTHSLSQLCNITDAAVTA